MGYNTSFNLDIIGEDDKENIIDDLRSFPEDAEYALDEKGYPEEDCKWHEYEKDIIKLSKIYPNNLFILAGKGEDNEDIWKHYFRNGKNYQIFANITFDDFDEKKLI